MRRFLLALLVAGCVAPAPANAVIMHGRPFIPGPRGRGTTSSTNWSGYATYGSGVTFTDVKGTWTVPTATCPVQKAQYASFWVGIDGYTSSTVEQTGTDSDCNGRNKPKYYAWYEMYPSAPVNLSMTIHPGNVMFAEVSVSGTSFTLTITDTTTGSTFTTTKTLSSATKTSAEWVAEAPSSCFIRCTVLPLANFGVVNFTGSFTTGNGHTGSINDGAWSNDEITMVTSGGVVKAQPSALSGDGQSFSVTWKHN
jgi:hypothetical protein